MTWTRLLGYVVAVELTALGTLFATILVVAAAHEGRILLDMTMFGERWIEYWLMVALVAIAPWAFYVVDRRLSQEGD